MNRLHPGARWLFRFRAYFSFGIFVLAFFIWLLGSALDFLFASNVLIVWYVLIFFILFLVIIGEIYARMAYNRWFYEFTNHGLRLERGIIWKRYSNVPYKRIQNVDVHRGVIARILGFSSIDIQTVGYSAYGKRGGGSESYIPAVSIGGAERIREFVMKRITKSKGGM